jgi:lipopolysaccharide export system protein LptA
MHGSAVTIQYDGKSDVVTFTGQATLDRLSDCKLTDRAQGQLITYNDLTDVFAVVGGKDGATPSNPNGRVRVMLSPRPAAQPAAKPSGPAPALKVSPGLGAKP